MHILAIETTDQSGSISLLDGDRVLQSRDLPTEPRSAATLAPAIADLLSAAGWAAADVKIIGVATGPGSFTGLRVGVTTAKMLAYAFAADVVGVNTLEVIACQTPPGIDRVWTAIDAQRKQLFVSQFARDSCGQWQTVVPTQIASETQWLAELTSGNAISGPALTSLKPRLPMGVEAVDESLWHPQAATVGMLAWQRFNSGQRDDIWSLAPQYFRLSAAEEEVQRQMESFLS
ncbi:MAG: tRNA (adenosine(37)-N6)-threonylcarbamoyltransferase complex dimerization subunit type 1 TsaB [Pirellulales bacterium]|nr:tRNA (adenosine(37)-N6)-threonylcarbamoyltransferase complex dimerization subunit type 1 TsaB [Pirellulales bacterium]